MYLTINVITLPEHLIEMKCPRRPHPNTAQHTDTNSTLITYFWRKTSIFKQSQEIGILSMYITTNFNGCPQFQQHGLTHKHFSSLRTELRGILGRQFHGRARFFMAGRQEQFNHGIHPAASFIIRCWRHDNSVVVVVVYYRTRPKSEKAVRFSRENTTH